MKRLNIKPKAKAVKETVSFTVRLDEAKAIKLARCRELLGGYSVDEIFNILADHLIEEYDDGVSPSEKFLHAKLK